MPAFLIPILLNLGGAALGGLGSLGLSAIQGIAGMAMSAVRGVAGLAFGLVRTIGGMALGIVGQVISGVVRFVVSIPGMLLGAVRGIVGFAGNLLGVMGNVAGTLLKLGTTVGGVVLGGIAAFAKGIQLAAQSAMEFSKNAATFGAMTGLGTGRGAGILNRFSSVGIGNEAVSGAFGNQNPGLFRLKASVFGLPGFDNADFAAKFAARYQSLQSQGMIGQMMSRIMTRSLGVDSPEFLHAATFSPSAIRSNQAYGASINARLGLTPEQLKGYAQAIPLLLARLGTGWTAITQKIAGIALPVLERGLGRVADFIGSHADQISSGLETAANWIFDVAPKLIQTGFQFITKALAWGVDTLIGIGTWISTKLPDILGGAVGWVSNTLTSFSSWISTTGPQIVAGIQGILSDVGNSFQAFFNKIADWIDSLHLNPNNPVRQLLTRTAQATDGAVGVGRGALGIGNILLHAPGAIAGALVPALGALGAAGVPGFGFFAPQNPITNFQNGAGVIPQTTLGPATKNFFNGGILPDVAKNLRTFGAFGNRQFGNLSSGVGTAAGYALPFATGALNGAAGLLSPQGQPNRGYQAGNLLGGVAGTATDFLSQSVKPFTDSIENLANGSNKGGKVESKLDELIGWTKRGALATEKGLEQGGSGDGNFQRAAGAFAAAISEQRGRAILSRR